jgi:penicillin-binding protein 1C
LLVSSRNQNEEFREPTNLVHRAICPLSGKLPSVGCPGTIDEIFLPGTEPRVPCSLNHQKRIVPAAVLPASSERLLSGVAIVVPQEGDIFKLDPVLRKNYQSILLKASVHEAPGVQLVEWRVNGRKIGDCRYPYSLAWNLSPGSYTIWARAIGKAGAIESRPVKILVIS